MFIFVATALAGTIIGWPCQRLNWGWRNVWSTCSINSYAPASGAEVAANIPTGFRVSNVAQPNSLIAATGIFTPSTVSSGAQPALLCSYAPNTGSGTTAVLRNRCRRAIDAYGALVKACAAPNAIAGNRGPVTNLAAPDYAPQTGHQPHVSNVQGLTHNAQFCTLPSYATAVSSPALLSTPSNTCPGLLGWFTVVYNVCGFTNAPGLGPNGASSPVVATAQAFQPYSAAYLGTVGTAGTVVTPNVVPAGVYNAGTSVGVFCSAAAVSPNSWNTGAGTATFRTSRCRKALDQFGRTANRCHFSAPNGVLNAAGPAQAGGYSDPLRVLATGQTGLGTAQQPMGLNVLAPMCN
jgi:hypothetical protein